jgi:molybdopterin converting factor small subunit
MIYIRGFMVEVTVKYFNILAAYAGQKVDTVTVPDNCTVYGLVLELVERNPPAFGNVVLSDGNVSSFIRVFVNDEMISGDDFELVLQNGDRVLLFPAVSGG